jgi:hypothetical protein
MGLIKFPSAHCNYCQYQKNDGGCNAAEETERIADDCLCGCDYFYPEPELLHEYGEVE